jgi:pantetheine-phosphate adenylyltransferase
MSENWNLDANTAVFAGSFDPPTAGHMDLMERAAKLYDKVYVLLGVNSAKKSCFPASKRLQWLQKMAEKLENTEVLACDKTVVIEAAKLHAGVLLRGVRNGTDLDYEANIAYVNSTIVPEIETVLLCARPQYAFISSSNVRELLSIGASVKSYLPVCLQNEPEFSNTHTA